MRASLIARSRVCVSHHLLGGAAPRADAVR